MAPRPRAFAWGGSFRIVAAAWLLSAAVPYSAASAAAACRLDGVEHEAECGRVLRPLDPARPQGVQIEVHYAVLPALARHKKDDPVFFLAGGPGQSAIDLAGQVAGLLARFSKRRDIVLVDQRGTGRSAPLACDEEAPTAPLRLSTDRARQLQRLRACRDALMALPHGDLRFYTTTLAMADLDAVRQALGAQRINLVAVSYGTRAALEYLRLFPRAVRRAVLDGVVPPDMVLPLASAHDNQAAFDALLDACEREAACRQRHPRLRERWQALLVGLPREVQVQQPLTGQAETLRLTRDMLLGMVRSALYLPTLASGLPAALDEAAHGRFAALVGLSSALASARREGAVAQGLHFSVVCAEDQPLAAAASAEAASRDFGTGLAPLYREVCEGWPRGTVEPAFYTVPATPVPTLLLSGGIDPVTPPRHAERVAAMLGGQARHEAVPNAGHGLLALPCVREAVYRFVDAATDAEALRVAADCARALPRPPAFVPLAAAAP